MSKKSELSNEQLASFCQQLHLILSSSIGITAGMDSIIEGFSNQHVKEQLNLTRESLELNNSLSSSLSLSGLFPDYMLTMVEVGEVSGKTDQVMESLALYYKKQDKLKKQIQNATTYPMVIALMVMVIIAVLVIQVLPIFSDVFKNLGGDMPASVDFVTKISRLMVGAITAVFGAFLLMVLFMLLRHKNLEGREKNRRLLAKLPGIRSIYHDIETAQFANTLSLLVSSGYDLHSSLELTEKTMEQEAYKQKIQKAILALEMGSPLGDVLADMKIFKKLHAQMLKLSVETGHLDTVLGDLADEYTDDVERSIEKMIGIIEPTLVGGTAFIIGGILLTVMLPLLGVMSSIG